MAPMSFPLHAIVSLLEHLEIGDQRLSLTIGPLEPPLATYPPKELPANENMKLQLGWYEPPPEIRALWADDEGVVLEDQIEEIAVSLFAYAEWAYRLGIQGQHEYRVRHKSELEERIRKQKADAERKERAQLEKAAAERRAILVSDTAAWRRAADIRAFVEAQVAKWSKEGMRTRWSDCNPGLNGRWHRQTRWIRCERGRPSSVPYQARGKRLVESEP
jgi:hypothetical protein